ncbi:MAG TPA: hypothetical protein GXX33_08660 [Firmicutes bacterium]|nr:hypothetical protein [Bacillota bacterium]
MRRKILVLMAVFIGFCSLIYLYTFLHEGGHALVAMLGGGKVEEFVLGVNAHVRVSGTAFTPFWEALFHAAGVLLPVIILLMALLFYRPQIKKGFYHVFYIAIWLCITGSLWAWVVIPLVTLFATGPAYDDTIKFLRVTGFHPLIVASAAILMMGMLFLLAKKKGLFKKTGELMRSWKETRREGEGGA